MPDGGGSPRLGDAAVVQAFRAESGRALATIARLTGDVALAEDAVQEAFLAALRHWPAAGVPANPGAWITTVARNRALDVLRREGSRSVREGAAAAVVELGGTPAVLHPIEDDQLRLMFTCCHPALAVDARVALTLRLVCGLRVPEIARLLLQGEEAVGKRLQRAKAKIRDAGIPLRVPPPHLLDERLPVVLECVYLVFTEGYAATGGPALVRAELCDEAVRLGRLLGDLLPDEPGVEALLALLLLQDSRRATRLDAAGAVVLLGDQDRRRWDHERIAEGRAWLSRAQGHDRVDGLAASYLLQAALAAEHARAPSWEATDWVAIVRLYDQLLALTGSPVVAVNRAVAVSFADGPDVAVHLLDALAGDPRVARSHLLAAARADVRVRLGDLEGARTLYELALGRAATDPERAFLRGRLEALTAR